MTATELIAKLEEVGEQFSHVPLVLRAEQGELLILVEFGNVHSGIRERKVALIWDEASVLLRGFR